MSAPAGWYPDPGGQPGMFRYWDGAAWSASLSPTPDAAPPSAGLGIPRTTTPAAGSAYAAYQRQVQHKRSSAGWWIGGIALLVVIIVVGVLAIRSFTTSPTDPTVLPGGSNAQNTCPPQPSEPATPPVEPNDGRVHGGPVSYPMLGSPWGAPEGDNRVPFGVNVAVQMVDVEPNYQPGKNWVASILVGELAAGDGFFTPQQGAQIVVRCILGTFYGDNQVQRDDKQNKATAVDGHDAWLVESQLSFDIEGLQTKGELLIVVIVADGPTAGLFYASIPDSRPDLVQPARDALKNLTVDT